ncbi:MAG: protein TolQ [Nitrospirae bacterium]|jgi:biopolymer transport protein TolQ|nr:protein TolQ [Nitrospirota bacterium]
MKDSAIHLVLQAGLVVKSVLIILLFFSIVSWAIIFFKHRYFSRANRETEQFLRLYRSTKDPKDLYNTTRSLTISPAANLFRAVYSEKTHNEKIEIKRLLKRYGALESAKLERYLSFLATTGSTTPFIGLFGTVWGIMNSFRGIGVSGAASIAVVAPGIAEALIATAAGLAAAIPAVITYNYYLSMSRRIIINMEDFSEELLNFFTEEKNEIH